MTETDNDNKVNIERQIIHEFTTSEELDSYQKEELKYKLSILLN